MRPPAAVRRVVAAIPPLAVVLAVLLALWLAVGTAADKVPPDTGPPPDASPILVEEFQSYFQVPKRLSWKKDAPWMRDAAITSTADGSRQPALFYDSGTDRDKPLLVGLHSWSVNYTQKLSIAFALWARRNDWVLILPDCRGINNTPWATVSNVAVQDIRDALNYARRHARVDPKRIYIAGFSGGGLATLAAVGTYPWAWTAAVAWVPIFDLVDWYGQVKRTDPHYVRDIEASCGGPLKPGAPAYEECRRRSPASFLENARGQWPKLLLAHGITDGTVPPSHSLRAFNALAAPEDRLPPELLAAMDRTGDVPPGVEGLPSTEKRDYQQLYDRAKKPLRFARSSENVSVEVFQGGHDIIFNAGLAWLARQVRE